MMNGVTSVGMNNQNYQMTFRAKGEKAAYEIVDQLHEAAKEITRPLEEKREALIRKSLQWLKDLKIKCPFIGKKVKPNEAAVEHIISPNEQFRERLIHAAKYEGLDTEKARYLLLMNQNPFAISFSEMRKNAKALKLIEQINEAHRQAYLQELKARDPEAYKEAVIKYMNEKFATMSMWEKLKAIAKEMLSKS